MFLKAFLNGLNATRRAFYSETAPAAETALMPSSAYFMFHRERGCESEDGGEGGLSPG
jgi:hypothetical protein